VTIKLIYAIVSVLIGGAAVTYEIWHEPVMLDRADGSGKFPSPKMRGGELVFFAVLVILLWPLLGLVMIFTERSKKP
jgi:hypothetical protein